MSDRAITELTARELADVIIPPVRVDDPMVVRDWKIVATQAQQDIRRGGRGDITVSSAAASMRLALVQLHNEGVTL